MSLSFDNSYARLPARFFQVVAPEPSPRPGLIRVNLELADTLGIDQSWLHSRQALELFAGNRMPPGAASIATAYAGHQFGNFNPQLGDGRALLIGELQAPSGERYDLQLKGSGRTPYSRGGDGRSPLGPVLREYILSEAMFALGVPTTRSLAAVSTGAKVYRQEVHPGGVLTRVAKSHIRVGTFEFFAARQDVEALGMLVDHVLTRHYPDLDSSEPPAIRLLRGVVERQARLIARWQLLGFIHGVMNTDNCLISGETIDYGPCAFIDAFDPAKVFSSIDRHGRYAYGNQPRIGAWNLMSLAEALLPLVAKSDPEASQIMQGILDGYEAIFEEAFAQGMRDKLGLCDEEDGDDDLAANFLEALSRESCDYTLSFRRLSDLAHPESQPDSQIGELFRFPESFTSWLDRWQRRVARQALSPEERQAQMYTHNPALIPRNHLVHAAIIAAEEEQHFCAFHDLVDALREPFRYSSGRREFALAPRPEQCVTQTFCGT